MGFVVAEVSAGNKIQKVPEIFLQCSKNNMIPQVRIPSQISIRKEKEKEHAYHLKDESLQGWFWPQHGLFSC